MPKFLVAPISLLLVGTAWDRTWTYARLTLKLDADGLSSHIFIFHEKI
jgi:hypothetical protein